MSDTKKLKIGDLKSDPRNANQGTERGLTMLEQSLRTYGAGRSVLLDKNNRIIAGNKTVERSADVGIDDVIVVETTGNKLVAVKRTDLDLETDKAAIELAIADNRIAQIDLSWSASVLEELKTEVDLNKFFSNDELNKLLHSLEAQPGDGGDEFDLSPNTDQQRVQPGDLWECAGHRILCGDSRLATDYYRLFEDKQPLIMVTDPPYGVEYNPFWRIETGINERHQKGSMGKVVNDDLADWTETYTLFNGAIAYVWHAGRYAATVARNLEDCGFDIRSQIIWAKQGLIISRGHYHWQHEPCWYAVRKGATASWSGDRKQSTLWQIDNIHTKNEGAADAKTGHSTQKPIECMARAIRNHGGPGDIVYDPFLGSGTTIIAAQRLKRVCMGMEINPNYVDLILTRIEAETGLSAQKLN